MIAFSSEVGPLQVFQVIKEVANSKMLANVNMIDPHRTEYKSCVD